IPYGHPSIFTSAFLNMVACVIYKPLGLLICIICEIGISTKCLSSHRQKHHDVPALTAEQISALEAYKLHESDIFEDWDNASPVVPGIPYQEGYMCTFQGCCFATTSEQRIRTHNNRHLTRNNWKSCTVQALYASMQIKYPVVVPDSPPALHAAPPGSQDLLDQVESFYEQHRVLHKGRLGPPMDRAHLNPFLAKYNWLEVIKDESPSDIVEWVKMPERDEGELTGILPCFQRYFGEIIKLLTDENAFRKTRILRAVNTTKSLHDLNNRPFKAPMRKQTVHRYVATFAKLIAFVCRAKDGHLKRASNSTVRKVALASNIQRRSKQLLISMDERQAAHSASHELAMVLLTTLYPPTTPLECPGKLFLIFSCVKLSGQILDPIHINPFMSELRWCLRAAAFYQICLLFENAPTLILENNPQALIEEVHRWLRDDCMNLFGDLLEIGHFLSFVTANTSLLPRMMWADLEGSALSFDGRLIAIADVVNLYRILMEETKVQLYEVVLLGAALPNIDQEHIYDDLSCLDQDYSFLSDRRNRFWEHGSALMKEMMSTFSKRFVASHNSSGVVWHQGQVRRWMKDCEDCLQKLFLLYHLGSGQPARGTELAIMSWKNTNIHPRNVYWFSGHLNFVSRYNKTQTNQEKERVISRSMPPEAAQLMIAYLTFTLAVLALYLSSDGQDFQSSAGYEEHLFNGLHGPWDSDDFSDILIAHTGRPVSEGGLGHPMGLADIRHLLIGVMRKNCKRLVSDLDLEHYFDEQSGHQGEVARGYAVDHSYVQSVSSDHLQKFVALSRAHHALLFPPAAPATSLPGHSPQEKPLPIDVDVHMLSELAIAPLQSALTPLVVKAISDAFAAYTFRQTSQPVQELCAGPPPINPLRFQELRCLMGRNASFKSIEQARASEAVSARLKDLIIVLGTGEGKTLLYMMPAVSIAEKNLASVVIVPLKALLDELRARFEDKGLLTLTWSPGTKTYDARTIFVSVEQLECPSFFDYLREGVQKGALSRIVIEESHYALTSKRYRPCLLLMPRLRQLPLQIVACTATLPPATIPRFLQHFQMLSGATEIIRGDTTRKDISFNAFTIVAGQLAIPSSLRFRDAQKREQSYLAWLAGLLLNLPVADKILVFCQTKATAQAMAKASNTEFYHSELPDEEKKKTLDGFKVGVGALRVLYTTSALSAGLDIRDIRAIVHLRKPSNMLDYGQEFGRGCRDGKPGWSFVFHDPKQKPLALQAGQDDTGVSEMASWLSVPACRRLGLSSFFDGRASSCLEMVTVQLCDICQMMVAKVLLMLS
ncbi:uncharacterized protein F5147DRAFT_589450, partial [Suillus discolor]